jgi:hypothetical protein
LISPADRSDFDRHPPPLMHECPSGMNYPRISDNYNKLYHNYIKNMIENEPWQAETASHPCASLVLTPVPIPTRLGSLADNKKPARRQV